MLHVHVDEDEDKKNTEFLSINTNRLTPGFPHTDFTPVARGI